MGQITGVEGSDVVVAAALAAILSVCAVPVARSARTRERPRLRFACYWILLLYSTVLVTTALVNLALVGASGFWLTAGGTGLIGVLVALAHGPGLWRAARPPREAPPAPTSSSCRSGTGRW